MYFRLFSAWPLAPAALLPPLLSIGLLLAACSADKAPEAAATPPPTAASAAVLPAAAPPVPAPPAPTDLAGAAGFDVAAVPVVAAQLGAFPYFSLLDGYEPLSVKNQPGNSAREFNKDVAFDRYEFFDGTKLIPVEGRLFTVKALGQGASFFQVQKTYEKLVRDLGGVTVFEGPVAKMKELKLKFEDGRHRARYVPDAEKVGVYVLRTPDRQVWVEVYGTWDDNDNYWLTVVEQKALPMTAAVLPAAELKKALDATGHVALYLNFDLDQATLRPDAQPTLAQVIALLTQNPDLRLAVQGHTDNAGSSAHNQQLSEARARTVMATLTAQGVAPARLQAAGFGQSQPLNPNDTEAHKARNRRVELVRL